MKKDIIIIGAGAAGIGMGCTLKQLGIENFIILEKGVVGESFFNWPKETRLITPSFTTNGFGFPDINAVVPNTSPAFTFEKEHLSGEEYGEYLQMIANHFDLPIIENCCVNTVEKIEQGYRLLTTQNIFETQYIIVATGEFQYPNRLNINGAELATHYGEIDSFDVTSENSFVVIGGNESGVDTAINLVDKGNTVKLYTSDFGKNAKVPDPSIALSPITKSRLKHILENTNQLEIFENKTLQMITENDGTYQLLFTDGDIVKTENTPLLATGFLNTVQYIKGDSLFTYNKEGIPLVNEHDESTISNNVFLVGPSLRHGKVIFCYIYKFRQRFAIVAQIIADRLNIKIDEKGLNLYKRNQMYLESSDCCDVICDC